MERLQSNGVEISRVVAEMTLTVDEYWMESMEIFMEDLDCTP